MSNVNIQQRKFVVKAGMTVDDVKNSKEATTLQKKYASAFDTDGQKGFSQKEADLFNSTTFSEKADGSVIFWTRQKDGTKKGTKFDSKDNIQYKTEKEVKPYVKKVTVKKAAKKQEESVSFFDEKWSGHQIAKLTGDNVVTDWLQNKDKVCTDGKDDGKLSVGQYALSFAKGLIGGIPKAIVNHPVATVVAVGIGAAAVALTGGAILPVLGAAGVVTGVGMAGYGGYKALTAETDSEAKQALETMGMGVATTALSVAAADKALEKATEAGVKSAQVSKDAGIIDKTIQMFKAIPESLTKSKEWARFNLNLPTAQEYTPNGKIHKRMYGEDSYREYRHNFVGDNTDENVLFEKMPNGTYKKYSDRIYSKSLVEESTTNGTVQKYDLLTGKIKEIITTDGKRTYIIGDGKFKLIKNPDGTTKMLYKNKIVEEALPDGTTIYSYDKLGKLPKGTVKENCPDGLVEFYPNYRYIKYNTDGNIKEAGRWYYDIPKQNSASSNSPKTVYKDIPGTAFDRFLNWTLGDYTTKELISGKYKSWY